MDIKQAGVELLEILKQGLMSGGKIVTEQFPVLCQQILKWGIIENIFSILLSIFIMVISYLMANFAIKKQIADEDINTYDSTNWVFLSAPSIIVGIVFFILFWCSIFEMVKILSAPNVYLMDYFKDLVSK